MESACRMLNSCETASTVNRPGQPECPRLKTIDGVLRRPKRMSRLTIRKDDLDTDQVIWGAPVFPAEDPQPAA